MKVRRFFLFAVVIMTFVMVAAFQGMAFCAPVLIDFDTPSYATGDLYGQNLWAGNDVTSIQVINTEFQTGDQSIKVNAGWGGNENAGIDYLDIGAVDNQFMWKFYWKPDNTNTGWTKTWLESSVGMKDGPTLSFSGDDAIFYYYNDGTPRSELLISDLNQTDWLAVVVIGNSTARTYDVYLNNLDLLNRIADDIPFDGNYFPPTELNYLNFQSTGLYGSNTHYYDSVHIGVVPIPGAVWLLGSGFIGLVAVRRRQG